MASSMEPPPRRPVVGTLEHPLTDIDRRQCKRVVPMKVLCLGLSRSGTSSLRQALVDLGYNDVYHYASTFENPRDAEMWCEALEAKFAGKGKEYGREEFDALLGHCMALTDTPCIMFYRELLAAYPDAKVILTVRDSPEQWWRSQLRTIIPFLVDVSMRPKTPLTSFFALFLPDAGPTGQMMALLGQYAPVFQHLVRDYKNGTREGVAFYEGHVDEVKRLVPEEKLLVMNVRQGWQPLCEFLGHDVPAWPFPHANSGDDSLVVTGQLWARMTKVMYWNMAKTLVPVATVGIVGVAWWLMRAR